MFSCELAAFAAVLLLIVIPVGLDVTEPELTNPPPTVATKVPPPVYT
jgi:hypothetical protein